MKYGLLVKKLYVERERYLERSTLKEWCKALGIAYKDALAYLIGNKYIYTILRGYFYVPSIEERKLGFFHVDPRAALAEVLKRKGVRWYFGLDTALHINQVIHQHIVTNYVLNDTIHRKNLIVIMGEKVRFVKLKAKLATFGIEEKNGLRWSDTEKTVLDMVYLARYHGASDPAITNSVADGISLCSKDKLARYAKNYNKKVMDWVHSL